MFVAVYVSVPIWSLSMLFCLASSPLVTLSRRYHCLPSGSLFAPPCVSFTCLGVCLLGAFGIHLLILELGLVFVCTTSGQGNNRLPGQECEEFQRFSQHRVKTSFKYVAQKRTCSSQLIHLMPRKMGGPMATYISLLYALLCLLLGQTTLMALQCSVQRHQIMSFCVQSVALWASVFLFASSG